jgi:enoyl-CoA hydratase/carnithine racemase
VKPTAKDVYETLIVARRGRALEITFNRPEKLNAISETMAVELMRAMESVESDREVLAVILAGNERAFSAGADLSGQPVTPDRYYDAYRARYNQRPLRRLFAYFSGYTKPVISAVEGYCLGGGFELAMLGDLIIAGEGAQFGLPEARLGLIPGLGGTQCLPRIVGRGLAKELMWTARRLGAAEALTHHIVTHVTPKGGALEKAREIVAQMEGSGPLAIMMIKQAVNRGGELPLPLAFHQEADLSYLLTFSEDRREGLKAFAEKRKPIFKGQ